MAIPLICDRMPDINTEELAILVFIQSELANFGLTFQIRRNSISYLYLVKGYYQFTFVRLNYESPVADLGGGRGTRPRPIFFIFMQFLAKIMPNIR